MEIQGLKVLVDVSNYVLSHNEIPQAYGYDAWCEALRIIRITGATLYRERSAA